MTSTGLMKLLVAEYAVIAFVGIELEERWAEIAVNRLRQEVLNL